MKIKIIMMYQNVLWPNPNPYYYNYDHSIMIGRDPGPASSYFWSIQFWFIDGTAGYMGLQTDLGSPEGNLGKGINLAIWNAIEAQPMNGAKVRPNTDGATGLGLYIPYVWQAGIVYRFRIWEINSDKDGIWWGFYVMNTSSNEEIQVGNLKTPLSMHRLSNASVVWTEYYGPNNTAPCNDPIRKEASVVFLNPLRNNGDYSPISTSIATPSCARYNISEPTFSVLQQIIKIE